MKVILLQDVKNLGKKNDVVNVPDGYFKNYLLPKKLAVNYSPLAQKHLQNDLADIQKNHDLEYQRATTLKKQIEQAHLVFELSANQSNAFGSISQKQIIESLKSQGIEINKFMFDKDFSPLKIGRFNLVLRIFEDVTAKLDVLVNQKQ